MYQSMCICICQILNKYLVNKYFSKKKKKVKMKGKNGGWGEGAHVFKANIIH